MQKHEFKRIIQLHFAFSFKLIEAYFSIIFSRKLVSSFLHKMITDSDK